MADSQKIVFLYREASVPGQIIEAAKSQTPDGFALELCGATTPDAERREALATADYIVAYGVPFDDLDVAKSARLFQLLSAGFDRLDLKAFADAGIPVANNGGANAPTVAEHAVLLMLSVFKKLPLHHNALQGGEWLGLREALRMRELRGKQVGIVGFGRIGREVARIVNGFLASPVYYDAVDAPQPVEEELKVRKMNLPELLATSDVVTLHTPLNDATRGLIGADELAAMKSTAILINTSRGPVVKEADLVRALDDEIIAGAGIDVFEEEPTATDNPLFDRDNVVTTPHYAGTTLDTWSRRLEFAFSNIVRVSRGDAPLSTVGG